jgi:rare lipoprotein A (peptidoglycan hydrolase)
MKKGIAFFLFFTLFTMFSAIITFAQDIQQGNATWYEDDSHELYASHARFPPGTRLRVTNLNNEREAYVTVNNRIQNSDTRILDLSQEAASLLGMNRRGSTPIRLVVIRGLMAEPESPVPETAGAPEYEDAPVPEITAISTDYGGYEDYDDYEDYENDYTEEEPPPVTASAETPPPPPIRVFPQQPASQSQQEPAAQPQAETQVLLKKIVVLINGKEQTIDIPDGVYIPLPVTGSTPSTPAYMPSVQQPSRVYIPLAPPPPRPVQPPVQAGSPAIKIIPKLPDPHSGKVYRVQVGAFSHAALAQVCFDRLKSAGFTPAFEQNGRLYRVVISGIKAADVSYTAQRLNAAGFTEAWLREESRH